MRFRLWEIILFVVLIVLTIVFGLLRSVWAGFAYFSAASVFALAIIFIINRIHTLSLQTITCTQNIKMYRIIKKRIKVQKI